MNDFSTSEIMKNYYTNISRGNTKDEALRLAKLDYLKNKDNSIALHPAFWAAFVQTGDTSPMDLVCKHGGTFKQMMYAMIIGGALLIILIAFGLLKWSGHKRTSNS